MANKPKGRPGRKNSRSKSIEVDFAFEYFEAKEVCLAGDFNDWTSKGLALVKQTDGIWRIRVPLPPGTYEYRYIVDGAWQNDPCACGFRPNEYGSSNCVLEVKPSPEPVPARID